MPIAEMVLSTEILLAWLIVAIGVLGFIVAHAIPRWYKAILPSLLALAVVAFGLYCVITIINKDRTGGSDDTEESASFSESNLSESRGPTVRGSDTGLADQLSVRVPITDTNPHYLASSKSLKVIVYIRNNGTKAVTSAKVSCQLPYRRNPRSGLGAAQVFRFEDPLEPGNEIDVVFTVNKVAKPEEFGDPRARVVEAH